MDGLKTFKPSPPLQELPPNICQKIFQTKMMRPNSTAGVFVIPFRDHLPLKSRTIGLQRIQSQCHPRPMHKFVRSSALAQPTLRSACDSIEGLAAADWKNFIAHVSRNSASTTNAEPRKQRTTLVVAVKSPTKRTALGLVRLAGSHYVCLSSAVHRSFSPPKQAITKTTHPIVLSD